MMKYDIRPNHPSRTLHVANHSKQVAAVYQREAAANNSIL
jgi:hypothetical protein